METDVDMETLDAVLDVFQKVGLELIVKLGPVLIALLAMLWGVRYVKRQFSAAKDSIVSVPSRALKGAAHAGQNLSAKAAAAASAAAQQIGGLAVDHALPVAQKAALVAVDGAKAGADQVVAFAVKAAPHAQEALAVAANTAKAGAGVLLDGAVKAAPVVRNGAGAAYDIGKKGVTAFGILAQVKADRLLESAKATRENSKDKGQRDPPQTG